MKTLLKHLNKSTAMTKEEIEYVCCGMVSNPDNPNDKSGKPHSLCGWGCMPVLKVDPYVIIEQLKQEVESLKATQEKQGWVKTSETAPDNRQQVIGYHKAGFIQLLSWNIYSFTAEEYPYWMPDPELPQKPEV